MCVETINDSDNGFTAYSQQILCKEAGEAMRRGTILQSELYCF